MTNPCGCSGPRGKVLDSRLCEGYRRRRYECPTCHARWTTAEVVSAGPGVRFATHPGHTNADAMVDQLVADRLKRLRKEIIAAVTRVLTP